MTETKAREAGNLTEPFEDFLHEQLATAENAFEYIKSVAAECNDDLLRLAIKDIWQASRKAAMGEAKTLLTTGEFCHLPDHMQGVCQCEAIAEAIREAAKEEG